MKKGLFIVIIFFAIAINPAYGQSTLSKEVDYFQDFLSKFHPSTANRVLVLHILKCGDNAGCNYLFALAPLFDLHLVPYINPKYVSEINEDIVIIRTSIETKKVENIVGAPVTPFVSGNEKINMLCDYRESGSNCSQNSFSYCYTWEVKDGVPRNFIMQSISELPVGLSFYNNEDIKRVEKQ